MQGHATERRYPRVTPKGLVAAWQTTNERHISRVESIGLGGLFLSIHDPPHIGAGLQLLFDVAEGEVRARAVVRSIRAGLGMGIEIISMQPEHRARLSHWINKISANPQGHHN